MTRKSMSDAVADHYAKRAEVDAKKPSTQTRWAPGADPLERVRQLAAVVKETPGYADTLNPQDKAAVATFLAREAHLAANTDTDDKGDEQ